MNGVPIYVQKMDITCGVELRFSCYQLVCLPISLEGTLKIKIRNGTRMCGFDISVQRPGMGREIIKELLG